MGLGFENRFFCLNLIYFRKVVKVFYKEGGILVNGMREDLVFDKINFEIVFIYVII